MERVVTINLNGNPYQLEEPAYDAVRAYLSAAEAALSANPDKAEIVRDLEQAIADKCASQLGPGKSVINEEEMDRVLTEMGPVQSDHADDARTDSEPPPYGPRKRLYRIKEGAQISGVCAGIAAYFDLDVNIIRLLFIVATLFTGGGALIIYIALMFLLPSAHTSEEWAAAHGMPFNAQEVIDRAKREYRRFADDAAHDWRAMWRARRREWREQRRAWREDIRSSRWRAASAPAPHPVGYVTRVFAGLLALILSLVGAALFIAFIVALFSLLTTGGMLHWLPPLDMPIWLVVVIVCVIYAAIAGPIGHLRRSSYAAASGYRYYGSGADGLITLLAIFAGGALAYHFLPEFRDWLDAIPAYIRSLD